MKLGVVFPQIESPADPIAIRDYAQAVEGMGFDYILAYDHVLGANPDRPEGWEGRPYKFSDPFQEIFVLFGYWAGVTEKIELAAGVLVLPQRQTALVAKQAAQIDVLSGGRLRLGVGVGWNYVEFEALNESFTNRGKRSDEMIELMNELWTKQLVTFDGKYHKVSDAGINPLPVQQPIPLWFGGYADATFRRIARYGTGWMCAGGQSPEVAKPIIDKIQGYMEDEGRDPHTLGLDMWLPASKIPTDQWLPSAQAWQAVGATHIAIETMRCGYENLDQHLATAKQFKEAVGELQS
ncbi:MAG: LLM class F420-dependent oxidoreductase [Chloroflexota bacterium]